MEHTTQTPSQESSGPADPGPITLTDKAIQMIKITREQ